MAFNVVSAASAVTQVTTRVLRDEIGVTKLRRPVVRIGYDEIAARPVARQGRVKPQASNEPVIGEAGAEQPVVAAPPANGDGERRDWQDQG